MQRINSPLSILVLDIDQFKQHNDQFGLLAGDTALQEMGKILKQSSRESDIVARQGGDEFTIILPNTDRDGALNLAEKVRTAIQGHTWQDQDLTISVGVSTILLPDDNQPNEAIHPTLLLSSADRALYESKRGGGNQVNHVYAEQAITAPTPESL